MTTKAKLLNAPIATARPAISDRKKGLEPHQFIRLYDEYFGRVYNYVRYRCEGNAVAEDIVALIFERALTRLGDFDPERGPFGAWLFTIARNMLNNHLRAENRRNCLSLEACSEQPDRAALPEEQIVRNETQAELLAAISCLNDRERDLLSLKFGACLTNRRIAEITGFSENNVGVILYRAVHKLRIILDESGSCNE